MAAQERGLRIWHRAKMLAHLGEGLDTLAVAGTHGKTTTSSMLASALDALGQDPTFLIGGIVRAYATNAHSGGGRWYVVEADESDKSFTHLSPTAVLVTNVEADHLDHYSGLDEIYAQSRRSSGRFLPKGPWWCAPKTRRWCAWPVPRGAPCAPTASPGMPTCG